MLKAAIYIRVSTAKQEGENQATVLREYAAREGWSVVEYEDQASGKTSDREAFNRLFEDARLKKFDLVLFWALDRFSREGALKTLELLQELSKAGVAWKSYSEQYLDSLGPFAEAVIAILAAIAKQERIRISERTLAGLARANAEGRHGGRPARIFDREKVVALREQGKSWNQISAEMGIAKATAMKAFKLAPPSPTAVG